MVEGFTDADYHDQNVQMLAYCISEDDLKALLQNIIQIETYRKELLEILKSIANVEVIEEIPNVN